MISDTTPQIQPTGNVMPDPDTLAQMFATGSASSADAASRMQLQDQQASQGALQAYHQGGASQFDGNPLAAYQQLPAGGQASLFGFNAPITQSFGNYNPSTEVFSGGVNSGTDFGVAKGTPISLPKGNWNVLQSYAGDTRNGHIGDNTNSGYGNSVLVRNADTGETMRFSHLSKVGVLPGQSLKGGVVGLSGGTGNATAPHLDLEYYDKQGRIGDVMRSAYAKYVLGKK